MANERMRVSLASGPPSRGALRRGLAVALAEAEAGCRGPASEPVGGLRGATPPGRY
jgi:hypothetical protein